MKVKFAPTLFLAVALTVSALPASANLIADGSFENPLVPAGSMCGAYGPAQCYFPGDDIGNWTVIGKSGNNFATVMLMTNSYTETVGGLPGGAPLYFNVQDGNQAIDLTGEGNQNTAPGVDDGVKQSVNLAAGNYQLSFWVGRQDTTAPGYLGSSTTDPASVALFLGSNGANATQVATFDNFTGGADNVNWEEFTYDFTADGYTTIAFLNNTAIGNNYAGLDNVVLSKIPEPSSAILVFSGLGAFIFRRRSTW
jgi:hypothetical protein